MEYQFGIITKTDYDEITNLQEIQDWLKSVGVFSKKYYEFDLNMPIVENNAKNLSLIYFQMSRDWSDGIYLLRIKYDFCCFRLDPEKRRQIPNFEIVYWNYNLLADAERKNSFKKEIQQIFMQGGKYLLGKPDDLTTRLLENIRFREEKL